MILIQVDGVTYENFVSAQVTLRMDSLCGTFSFTATTDGTTYLPFTGGERCEIYADGVRVLSGNIEIVEASYTSNNHNITIQGRHFAGDLLDSTLDSLPSLKGQGLTVKALIEKVLNQIGLGIFVVDEANPAPFNQAEDVSSPQPGENAFDFLEKYTRKRQVLLNSNGDGDIVIAKSTGTTISASLKSLIDSNENNIIQANASYDRTGRYNAYRFASSLNTLALNSAGNVSIEDVTNQRSDVVADDEIPAGRQLVLIAETSASSEQNTDRSKWERNIRRARGRVYTATVSGFRNQTGDLWMPNTVISVQDDRAAINGQMLVNTVTFDYSNDLGSQTTLTLLPPDAYSLDLIQPVTGSVGNALFN